MTLARVDDLGDRLVIVNMNVTRRGALSPDLYDAINDAVARAVDPHIRAIILTAEGGFFCAGGDLNLLIERRTLPENERRNKVDLLHDLVRGIRACPMRIRTILTDNGKEFTDRLFGLRKRAATGEHEFDTLCAALDIEHRLTPPKSPQTNGMVERFNGRIEEVLQSHHFRSGEELETTLHRYVWLYNQQLPQSALGSKTPLQAMKEWHKIKPQLFNKQPYYLPGCDT